MALLAIQQTVRDYRAWRAVYDTLGEVQRDWGVTAESVHQCADAPDTILVQLHFATVAQARGYLTNREVRAAMRRAGVEGTPRVEIYVSDGARRRLDRRVRSIPVTKEATMSADEVRQVSDRFYAGMNRAINGDHSAMSDLPDLCSRTDDMSVMSEVGGRQLGWPEVRAFFEMGAQAASGGSVEVSDRRITLLGPDGAYATGTLTASVNVGTTPLNFSARCTDVFRREGGAWKLIHHHLDVLPDAAAFQSAMAQDN